MIPFLDLKAYNQQFQSELKLAFGHMLNSGHYILGDGVRQFEGEFAKYCGTEYCIGTGNGLDALTLIFSAYLELGSFKPGDEVIVPANTYFASILSIIRSGLRPVLVEPNLETYNLDPYLVTAAISDRTVAILAVHLYGQLADMASLSEIAKTHELYLIEDAAQAHGAKNSADKRAGNLGHAAAFSFYPTKNLGALGDAGCVTTNDEALSEMVKKLRNYGSSAKDVKDYLGFNSRLDEIQAMFLSIKLKHLDNHNALRQGIAKRYLNTIENNKLELPFYSGGDDHVFHQFVIRTRKRQDLIDYLNSAGIGTMIHYPIPPHKQKALSSFNNLELTLTEEIHETVLSIPINPLLTDQETGTIIELLNTY